MNYLQFNSSLGQVWTPKILAEEMILEIAKYLDKKAKVLDPACGPGTFFLAARQMRINFDTFSSFEIDPKLVEQLTREAFATNHNIICGDFLTYEHKDDQYDAIILNPPYIRHEQIAQGVKELLNQNIREKTGYSFTRRMNYFGYFLILCTVLLKKNGVLSAIIYDSLDKTQYGNELIQYLNSHGNFLSRRKVATPFNGRMIDAEIILWQKNNENNLCSPELLIKTESPPVGYCYLEQLGSVKRGTSFPKREIFVKKEPGALEGFICMVTKQPLASGLIVEPNTFGIFMSENQHNSQEILKRINDNLVSIGKKKIVNLPIPVYGDILFNYYFRGNARHLLNLNSIPASDNFYCFKPMDSEMKVVHWVLANSHQYLQKLINASRTQGSGLRKLQLFEYSKSHFPDYRNFAPSTLKKINDVGNRAIREEWSLSELMSISTEILNLSGFHYE